MSQAFQCDLCGDCVASEDLAKSEREVARESTTINGTQVDIGIIIRAYIPHVCNTCWGLVMDKVKAWVNANI